MDSRDFMDCVLLIGNNELSNQIFVEAFTDFGKRHLRSINRELHGPTFLFMLYNAIFTIPLTDKIRKHHIDALMVAKIDQKVLLAISYATPDSSLSLKLVRFYSMMNPPISSMIEDSLLFDMKRVLSSVKRRYIQHGEFEMALKEFHDVVLEPISDIAVSPKLSKISSHIQSIELRQAGPEFKVIMESEFEKSASIFAKQLQSENYDVLRYNYHAFIKLLIMQHQIATRTLQSPMLIGGVYLFLAGAIDFNWGRSHGLNIQLTFKPSSTIVDGMIINHSKATAGWNSENTRCFMKLLSSPVKLTHGECVKSMYVDATAKLKIDTSRLMIIGIEYRELLMALHRPMDIYSLLIMPYTHLLDLNPWENIVDILLNPYNEDTVHKVNYCIENLNREGRYGLHLYLYGQLASYNRNDIEKYVYHDTTVQGLTRFTFKSSTPHIGVLFDIFQSNVDQEVSELPFMPSNNLRMRHFLHVTVHQVLESTEHNVIKVHLKQTSARVIEGLSGTTSNAEWLPIPTLNAENILTTFERRPETYELLTIDDPLHTVFSSLHDQLLRFQDQASFRDITPFIVGLYSDWDKITYHGFLGVLKNDGTALFVSPLHSDVENGAVRTELRLKEIMIEYIANDFTKNAMRRIATFVYITYAPEGGNNFATTRLSTFGKLFHDCLPSTSVRRKRKLGSNTMCLHDKLKKGIEEALTKNDPDYEKLAVEKASPLMNPTEKYLKIVDGVSRAIMTSVMFKDMVGALIRGDYKTFAVNTAFLAGGPLLECLSVKLVKKGASLGRSFAGRSLIFSAPFLSRLPVMGFVGYDLYEQVEAYQSGDRGAMVNIVGDSTILTIDIATASVEGAEALGLMSGVADTMGPIGLAIGTAIFVGTDIYSSVKVVSNIESTVHLTGWQKFTTGLLSFLHLSPTKAVQNEIFEKRAADASIENAVKFFDKYTFVKYYFFPSYEENGDFVKDNIIDLRSNVTRTAHSWPKDMINTRLLCAGYSKLNLETVGRILLNCSNAFGYESSSSSSNTVIMIGDGNDIIRTFRDKPTTFLIGNGDKQITGSSEGDMFVLQGNDTTGSIEAGSGINVLNIENFSKAWSVKINLEQQYLSYTDHYMKVINIRSVIGRPMSQEIIECGSNTIYVDSQGGSPVVPDLIFFKANQSHNTTIKINGKIRVKNEAAKGNFRFLFSCQFDAKIFYACGVNSKSFFVFNQTFHDISSIKLSNISGCRDATFRFRGGNILKITSIPQTAVFTFKDQAELRIVDGTISFNLISNDTVEQIYSKYKPLSHKLNAIIRIHSTLNNISMLFGSGMVNQNESAFDKENNVNILSTDPYHETYLFGGKNQNVFRVSTQQFHNVTACSLDPMPRVIVKDYTENGLMNVIDLYEAILLIRVQFNGRLIVQPRILDSDILLSIQAQCADTKLINLLNITVHKALENENYEHIVVNLRRPMKIMYHDKNAVLTPVDYDLKNSTYAAIHASIVEPFTTIVSQKVLGMHDIVIHNDTSLIITNAKFTKEEKEMILIVLVNFFYDAELQTLRFRFVDQMIDINREYNRVQGRFPNVKDVFNDTISNY